MDLAKDLILIFITVIFSGNFVFSRSLGLCPYLGVSRNTGAAFGMGLAVIFVMTLASVATWIVYRYLLIPFHIEYLYIVSFILIIATLVQFVEMVLEKNLPTLYQALGIYLPLITTNCAVLGIAVVNMNQFFQHSVPVPGSFIKAVVSGFGCGIGFTLALVIMSGIREQLELAEVPQALKDVPIAFLIAGIISLTFMGFM